MDFPRYFARRTIANVRFGSKADICSAKLHVRFTPKSGHVRLHEPDVR